MATVYVTNLPPDVKDSEVSLLLLGGCAWCPDPCACVVDKLAACREKSAALSWIGTSNALKPLCHLTPQVAGIFDRYGRIRSIDIKGGTRGSECHRCFCFIC